MILWLLIAQGMVLGEYENAHVKTYWSFQQCRDYAVAREAKLSPDHFLRLVCVPHIVTLRHGKF